MFLIETYKICRFPYCSFFRPFLCYLLRPWLFKYSRLFFPILWILLYVLLYFGTLGRGGGRLRPSWPSCSTLPRTWPRPGCRRCCSPPSPGRSGPTASCPWWQNCRRWPEPTYQKHNNQITKNLKWQQPFESDIKRTTFPTISNTMIIALNKYLKFE